MNFYASIFDILTCKSPKKKFELFKSFYAVYQRGEVTFEEGEVLRLDKPSYSAICKVVSPKEVAKRRKLQSSIGQKVLLHSIAHIEYSAVDLALDAAYRFRGLPKAYYDDWLEVAKDEIRHFLMIESLLKEMGSYYGQLSVHNALFEAAQKTQTLLERMAVVPRHFEASGLDVNPEIIEKISLLPSTPFLTKISDALNTILDEEISHVKKGDRWFKYACKMERKSEDIYFDIVKKHYPHAYPRVKHINIEARLEAGFTCKELNTIANKSVC